MRDLEHGDTVVYAGEEYTFDTHWGWATPDPDWCFIRQTVYGNHVPLSAVEPTFDTWVRMQRELSAANRWYAKFIRF